MIYKKDVEAWIIAKANLNTAKKQESELRLSICEEILDGKVKGSKKSTIGRFILTATAKLNEKVDEDLLDTIWEDLADEEKECIEYKPSIKAKEFHKLKDSMLLHRAIDSKPGMPALAIKGEAL